MDILIRRARDGNTPTGVGKTVSIEYIEHDQEKHPHGRGEDPLSVKHNGRVTETPPRAWGRQRGRDAGERGGRNTPTGVGKT